MSRTINSLSNQVFEIHLIKFKFYINFLKSTFMLNEKLGQEMRDYLLTLEDEYPGISRINFEVSERFVQKLEKLITKMKYSVPKSFYSDQTSEFKEELEKIYDEFSKSNFEEPENIDELGEYLRRKKVSSDQEEALISLPQNSQLPKRYEISMITNFLQDFKFEENRRFINRGLIEKNLNLESCSKKEANVVLPGAENRRNETRMDRRHENTEQKNKNNQNLNHNQKKQDKKYVRKNQKDRVATILTLGDKIPLEVKQMRNEVKKLSQNSFSITSQLLESQLSLIETAKREIRSEVNKLAKENQKQVFYKIGTVIILEESLAEYFIDLMIEKCHLQYREIEFYSEFCKKFTKIPIDEFKWNWSQSKEKSKRKFNPFHRLFVQKIESQFEKEVELSQGKHLISLCRLIAALIVERVFPQKIYFYVNQILFQRIIEEIQGSLCHEKIQIYFECHFSLIEGLSKLFEKIWSENNFSKTLCSPHKQIQPKSSEKLQDFLFTLIEKAKLPTSRIKFLLMNILERKDGKEQEKETKVVVRASDLKESVWQILTVSQKPCELKALANESNLSEIFEIILESIYDGKKDEVSKWLQIVFESIEQENEKFLEAWKKVWENLIFQQCEYPFMVTTLAQLGSFYLEENSHKMLIELGEEDPDFEDTEYFMNKLEKELSKHSSKPEQ